MPQRLLGDAEERLALPQRERLVEQLLGSRIVGLGICAAPFSKQPFKAVEVDLVRVDADEIAARSGLENLLSAGRPAVLTECGAGA